MLIESMFPERDRLSGSRAKIDLLEVTPLKACIAIGGLEATRQLVDRSRGPRGIPVAGLEVLVAFS
jgi:hypothetical protein